MLSSRALQPGFNPRLREGGDSTFAVVSMIGFSFNPRLREGGDYDDDDIYTTPDGFNPRLREGGDPLSRIDCALSAVSIHASAREATPERYHGRLRGVFQSTPPRGRRLKDILAQCQVRGFNPRLREGGDTFR